MSSNAQSSSSGKLGISLPSINQPYAYLPELAGLADEAGFDSIWNYEVHRNPFLLGAICATATKNVALGTGLAAAAGRSRRDSLLASIVVGVAESAASRAARQPIR